MSTIQTPEPTSTLTSLIAAPLVWAAHFLVSYATSAIWCAKLGADRSFHGAQLAIAGYTVASLIAIGLIGTRAWRQYRSVRSAAEDRDSSEARHRFIVFVTLLLAGLGLIAILYGALAIVLVGSCR
jgi:hypothetical protein